MGDIRYNRLLKEGVELDDDDLEELVAYCVVVFENCQEQLPSDLFKRLVEHELDMDWFFDTLLRTAGSFKIIRVH